MIEETTSILSVICSFQFGLYIMIGEAHHLIEGKLPCNLPLVLTYPIS